MDSHRIPPLPKPPGRFAPEVSGAVKRLGRWGLAWCNEHRLWTAGLLLVPLTAGMFFWNRGTAEVSITSQENKGEYLPGVFLGEEAPLTTVIPESGPGEGFALAPGPGEGSLESPRPLPIAVVSSEGPGGEMSQDASASGCVWLTGSIEPLESRPEVIREASRVHELTRPVRH